ncbi:MAG: hypothetical protein Q9179_002477 [Wetmoreana sp. 5 TL-2023]
MHRTNTTTQTSFPLPGSNSVTFDFSTLDQILITIPRTSNWNVPPHWHSDPLTNLAPSPESDPSEKVHSPSDTDPGHNASSSSTHTCHHLLAKSGTLQVSWWREPRTGASTFGTKDYYFQPPKYWTTWSRDSLVKQPTDLSVTLFVREDLYRNICSATLDAGRFPELDTTPLWLKAVFRVLRLVGVEGRLVNWCLYVQIQAMKRQFGYWEYHGGINALRWWQWSHPWDIGNHPAWTVRLQYRSQRLFSKAVQGGYYWLGRGLGMKGDYREYNPRYEQR